MSERATEQKTCEFASMKRREKRAKAQVYRVLRQFVAHQRRIFAPTLSPKKRKCKAMIDVNLSSSIFLSLNSPHQKRDAIDVKSIQILQQRSQAGRNQPSTPFLLVLRARRRSDVRSTANRNLWFFPAQANQRRHHWKLQFTFCGIQKLSLLSLPEKSIKSSAVLATNCATQNASFLRIKGRSMPERQRHTFVRGAINLSLFAPACFRSSSVN